VVLIFYNKRKQK